MPPVTSYKEKGLQVAVWENRTGGYSYTISKRYKDKQTGEWKDSKYLYKEDMEALTLLIQSALSYAHDRAEHQHEGIPSGQGKAGPSAAYEIDDDDLIPF
jgi:hypothetical protein